MVRAVVLSLALLLAPTNGAVACTVGQFRQGCDPGNVNDPGGRKMCPPGKFCPESTSTTSSPAGTPVPSPGPGKETVCAQVITCGLKDGKPKEYADPCKAREDGATNIAPKTAGSCPAVQ